MSEPSVDDDLRWLLGMEFYPIAIGGRVQQPDRLYYESLPGDKARIARIAAQIDNLRAELATANKREEIAVQNTKLWVNAQNDTQKRLAAATQQLAIAELALRDIAEHQTTGVYGLAQQALDDMKQVKHVS